MGLTASVHRDPMTKEWFLLHNIHIFHTYINIIILIMYVWIYDRTLEGGALVLADQGYVVHLIVSFTTFYRNMYVCGWLACV